MLKVTYENDEGEEVELELPSKMEVCWDCEGHGTVLTEGMRNHAYSMEEFRESFDEEEAQEYFTRGGRYDVQCPTCHGANVMPVVDEEHIPENLKAQYAEYQKHEEQKARWDAEDRATRRMEDGGFGDDYS
jgi:hypothetical protein